jgi:hypothetical protein
MIRAVLSAVVAVALAVVGLPWCALILYRVWLSHVWQAHDRLPQDPFAVLMGLLMGLALVLWKKPNWLLHTSIHECCHLLACLGLFVPVRSFQASDGQGGMVTHDRPDPLRDTLIAIAPYTIPFLLVPALLARVLVPEGPWRALTSGLSAFAFVQHLQGLYHNIRLNFWGKDSDLARVGRPLSGVLIAGALMLVAAWVINTLWE